MNKNSFKSIIKCTKDVVMENSKEVAFNKDKTYKANIQAFYVFALNNEGTQHCIKSSYGADEFFDGHFEVVKNNSHKW